MKNRADQFFLSTVFLQVMADQRLINFQIYAKFVMYYWLNSSYIFPKYQSLKLMKSTPARILLGVRGYGTLSEGQN